MKKSIQLPRKKLVLMLVIVILLLTAALLKLMLSKPSIQMKVYTNEFLGLQFQYPSSWIVSNYNLPLSSNKQETASYTVHSSQEPVEVITFTNPSRGKLIIEGQKNFIKDTCGGIAMSSWKYGFPSSYKQLSVLGREAVRAGVEEGEMPLLSEEDKEPYIVSVYIKRIDGELSYLGSMADYPYAANNCFEDEQSKLRLKVTYTSPDFTEEKIFKGEVDDGIFEDLDIIIASMTYL